MFIGRQNELYELNKLYDKSGFKFVVIYGRRRVGKTSLITEFIKDKDSIFYIAIERNDSAALKDFSTKVLNRFPSAVSIIESFASWDKAFLYIAEQAKRERIVLAIDEYPYIAAGNPSISSILQKYIDTDFRSSNIFLILCGSSMSFMENQILGYASPLYGRRSAQFKINPFDYYDAGLFFETKSPEDKMLAYAVCGGIPQYLAALAEYDAIIDGIYECFFKKSGIMYEEPENLLKQELREPAIYNTLITSIANGASKLNEIATKSGEESKKTSKYLKSLLNLHIIQKEHPYSSKLERNGVYKLQDNMFRFWYRYIPQNVTNIESGLGRQVIENRVLHDLPGYIGRIYEDACREFMLRKNGTQVLPFLFDGIGRWWGTSPISKEQEEIDILADSNNKAIFGECKWSTSKIELNTLLNLQRKSTMFKRYDEQKYILFSKTGFNSEIIKQSKNEDTTLVELQEMYASS